MSWFNIANKRADSLRTKQKEIEKRDREIKRLQKRVSRMVVREQAHLETIAKLSAKLVAENKAEQTDDPVSTFPHSQR